MIDPQTAIAAIGLVAGAVATVLAVAQLTCEHAASGFVTRAATVGLGILAFWTGVDCWEVWAGTDDTLDAIGVGFCVCLSLSWGYRRSYRILSVPAPKAKAAANGVRDISSS